MCIYDDVKSQLSVKDAAEYYGLNVNRSGYVSCIFHKDRTPSMKLYEHNYHCYGCGKHGDVINLASALLNLLPHEAVQKLSRDFRINTDSRACNRTSLIEKVRYQTYIARENRAFLLLNDYCDYLLGCRKKYAPKGHGDELHPLFVKSLNELDKYSYYLDFMINGDREKRKQLVADLSQELTDIKKLLNQSQKRKEIEK